MENIKNGTPIKNNPRGTFIPLIRNNPQRLEIALNEAKKLIEEGLSYDEVLKKVDSRVLFVEDIDKLFEDRSKLNKEKDNFIYTVKDIINKTKITHYYFNKLRNELNLDTEEYSKKIERKNTYPYIFYNEKALKIIKKKIKEKNLQEKTSSNIDYIYKDLKEQIIHLIEKNNILENENKKQNEQIEDLNRTITSKDLKIRNLEIQNDKLVKEITKRNEFIVSELLHKQEIQKYESDRREKESNWKRQLINSNFN